MIKKQKNLIAGLLVAGFLISSILSCVLAAQNSFMKHEGYPMGITQCCDSNLIFGGVENNTPFILNNSSFQLLLLVIIAVYLVIKNNYAEYKHNSSYYFKIRDRYGGFNLFYYFILLFSKGILHPKIY